MKSLKRKFIVSLIAIMFAIVALGASTYAYWSSINLTAEVTDQQVTIGEAKTSTVTASLQGTLPEGKFLVPAGQKDNSINSINSVEFVTFEYKVFWKDNLYAGDTNTPLTVTITNLFLGGSNTYSGLVNTEINAPAHIGRNVETTVTIKLTLTKPSTEEIYDAIFGKNITFNITFTVAPVTTPAI